MVRVFSILLSLAFSISIPAGAGNDLPLRPVGMTFQGQVRGESGNPIPGAEVRILDSRGVTLRRALSGMDGAYRFPMIQAPTTEAFYQIEISHLRFQTLTLQSALAGAILGSPSLKNMVPGGSAPLWGLTRIVHRDFVLKPERDPSRLSATARLDPFQAEYFYREALLLLSEMREGEAIQHLKIYAQIGSNPIEIEQSLKLVAARDR